MLFRVLKSVCSLVWVVLTDWKDVEAVFSPASDYITELFTHSALPLCIGCSLHRSVSRRFCYKACPGSILVYVWSEGFDLRAPEHLYFYHFIISVFIYPSFPLSHQAISNKDQHSISYTLSRAQTVVVEYTHDSNTDMFQVTSLSHSYSHAFLVISTPGLRSIVQTVHPHFNMTTVWEKKSCGVSSTTTWGCSRSCSLQVVYQHSQQ